MKEIKSFAKSKKFENFKAGYGIGAKIAFITTSGAIAIVTLDRPEEFHYALFFAMVIVPPAAIAGGTINGLINMNRATQEIEKTELYKINIDSWRIKVPNDSKKGFRKFHQ